MDLNNKRTRRRAIAFAAVAAVAAGGVGVAQYAGATSGLALTPAGTSFTTLDVGAQVVASAQTLTVGTAGSMGASFTVTYASVASASILKTATAATMQTALNAVSTISAAGGVTVSGSGNLNASNGNAFTVTFNVGGLRTAFTTSEGQLTVAGTLGGGLAASLASATYAARVTTTTPSTSAVVFDTYTAPGSGALTPTPTLLYKDQATATSTGPTSGWVPLVATGTGAAVTNNSNNVFVTGNVPGVYTFHFANDNGTPNATGDDIVSDTMTMTVLDVEGVAPTTTGDDWLPSLSVASSTVQGVSATATVPLSGLTLVDARSTNSTGGLLGGYIAANVAISATGAGLGAGPNNGTLVTFTGTSGTVALTPTVAASSPMVSTALFDKDGSGAAYTVASDGFASARTASTVVTDNLVTAFSAGVTEVTGSTVQASSSTATVKVGVSDITYTATADTLSSGTDKSGKVFYFTLTPGTNTPALTADGTLVSTSGTNNTTKLYSAVTDSTGVAKLKITSSLTTAGTTYSVAIDTNGVGANTDTVTYAASSASAVKITSSTADLSPVAGTATVTINGKLTDQFSATYIPLSSAPQQVNVGNAVTGFATLSNGTFSYAYTPSSAPAAGTSQTLSFTYNSGPTVNAVVNWASATAPANVTISAPTSAGTPAVALYSVVQTGAAVTGTVTDSGAIGLAYKTVTLSGSPGVYFSTVNSGTDLAKTLAIASGSSGTFSAYVYYTKSGKATITATSGDKTVSVTPVVADPIQPAASYKVLAIDAAGAAGSTLVVSGKVTDVFGNPVPSAPVVLSASTATLGVLGSSGPTTNANGEFSTSFVTGSLHGTVTITATINSAVNKTAATTWLTTAGLTLAGGASSDTATLTIGSGAPTLTGPATHAAGTVTLTGTGPAGASVDIYAKAAGSSAGFVWVGSTTADATTGDWSKAVVLSGSTTYVARVGTVASSELTVSAGGSSGGGSADKVTVGTAGKALGKQRATISVMATPATTTTIRLYVLSGGKYVLLKTWTSTSTGRGSLTVKTSKGSKTFRVILSQKGKTSGVKDIKITVK